MEKSEQEDWYFFVREGDLDNQSGRTDYFKHKEKEEALRRAHKNMKLRMANLVTDYKMGKPLVGLHRKVFILGYASSADGGKNFTEEIMLEKYLKDDLGNHAV